ncbi:MAG TPA: alpha-L-fucosidase [Bryobacteraceae bacterium]|nr:alpha-L-fucosidase [Bryobacteraceae bacterium]
MKPTRREALATIPVAFQLSAQTASSPQDATRARRMQWWHDARFGMFIHFGLYSVLGRHEWAMENEAIPVSEYQQLAKRFNPKPNAARDWARLAKQAGQKYMVMTTKHHEGFCLFNSKYTEYCAPKQAAGRDLVKEFVDAVRAEGLTPGFYYSLMDWHHPDGARCATDEAARRRFVDYIHGQVRELMTNYGKVGVLWYDVPWPLDAKGWESEKMNKMVFELQPDIIVNNRNQLPGDFSTPEQRIQAETGGRAWESCMTMNDSWGYQTTDDDWKSPKTVIRNLITCSRDGGNYLLNIGPRGDGSIPDESVRILQTVGKWIDGNGKSIYQADVCKVRRSAFANFTRKGNTLYIHAYFWPGSELNIAGLRTKVKSASLLRLGTPVKFTQTEFQTKFTGLPVSPPDSPVTTLVVECEGEPVQDTDFVRKNRERLKA